MKVTNKYYYSYKKESICKVTKDSAAIAAEISSDRNYAAAAAGAGLAAGIFST